MSRPSICTVLGALWQQAPGVLSVGSSSCPGTEVSSEGVALCLYFISGLDPDSQDTKLSPLRSSSESTSQNIVPRCMLHSHSGGILPTPFTLAVRSQHGTCVTFGEWLITVSSHQWFQTWSLGPRNSQRKTWLCEQSVELAFTFIVGTF